MIQRIKESRRCGIDIENDPKRHQIHDLLFHLFRADLCCDLSSHFDLVADQIRRVFQYARQITAAAFSDAKHFGEVPDITNVRTHRQITQQIFQIPVVTQFPVDLQQFRDHRITSIQ